MDGQTDTIRTDKPKDGQTNGTTDGQTDYGYAKADLKRSGGRFLLCKIL